MTNAAVYTAQEVAHLTGLSVDAVYAARQRGDIPGLKIGARVVFPRKRFDLWFNGQLEPDVKSPVMGH